MVNAIAPVGCCWSVSADFYIEQVRKNYRFKKEIAYFNENIQNCPTIYPDGTVEFLNRNNNDGGEGNENKSLKNSRADDIQNELSFKKSKQNNVDTDDNDLFMKLADLINQKENKNTDEDINFSINNNNEISKNLREQKLGPPLGFKIENFDYWTYFDIAG